RPADRQGRIGRGRRGVEIALIVPQVRPAQLEPHQTNALISMPSAVRRSRTALAICTAPGESPWTHTDSTVIGMVDPSTAATRPAVTIDATRSAISATLCNTA